MTGGIHIASIARADIGELIGMMGELAEHEGLRGHLGVSRERLAQTGCGDDPQWAGLIARADGAAAGYATFATRFHIWSGAIRIALDDVYVRPAFRGRGVGESLMRRVFRLAREGGMAVTWTVRPENKAAIAFYERLGARYDVVGTCIWRAGALSDVN